MGQQENVAIVRRGYEAFGKGNLDGLISLMDDNVEWVSPGPKDLPTAGQRRGQQEVRKFFGSVNELYDFESFEPETFVSEGDLVVVLGTDRVKVKATGKTITESWAHAFTVKNGKIVRFQEYIDTAAAVAELRAAGART